MAQFFFWGVVSLLTCSLGLGQTFEKGKGAEYLFIDSNKSKVLLDIYVADSSFTQLSVEYFFRDTFGLTKMWQRFDMEVTGNGPLNIKKGYLQNDSTPKAFIMTDEFLKVNRGGVEVADFVFAKQEQIDGDKIGEEVVETPGGSLFCLHYRKKHHEQTVDFWISDSIKPIGLVKLVSTGKQAAHQYTVELNSLLEKVPAHIDPQQAQILTEKDKEHFPHLKKR